MTRPDLVYYSIMVVRNVSQAKAKLSALIELVQGHYARQVALLPWHHRDPFDRMLVAQAEAGDLILLTADHHLTPYGDFVHLVR